MPCVNLDEFEDGVWYRKPLEHLTGFRTFQSAALRLLRDDPTIVQVHLKPFQHIPEGLQCLEGVEYYLGVL